MVRYGILFVTVVLVLAACTTASEPENTSAAPTTAVTEETPTTEEAPPPATTTVPEATTTTIQTARAAAEAVAGTYEGEWRNLTFGSSGAAAATLVVSGDNLVVVFDLDGQVFGASDPDPEDITLPLADLGTGVVEGESPLFGPFTLTVTADGFTLEASAVPAAGIASMTVVGTIEGATIAGTYEIAFEGGGGANGEFELTR